MELSIENLGCNYKEYIDYLNARVDLRDFMLARVFVENRGVYKVRSKELEYLAKVTGKKMFSSLTRENYPAVGDWVAVEKLNDKEAVIREILPRKNVLRKQHNNSQDMQVIAANIDVAFIVESVDRDYNLNRYERYLVLAREAGIKPVLVLNKVDLISLPEINEKLKELGSRFVGIDIIVTSTLDERGLQELEGKIEKGITCCLLGSSGVGKSSIINKLLKTNSIRTEEISLALNRGKHTTTTRTRYVLEKGGIVIDNPGIRAVGTADMDKGIDDAFEDVCLLSAQCKYSNCTHTHEPGCSVKELIERGEISKDKYENYIKLKKESEYYRMTKTEKRAKDRNFGRLISKAQKVLKEDDLDVK